MVARTRLNVTLYVYCLYCFRLAQERSSGVPFNDRVIIRLALNLRSGKLGR